VDDHSSATNVTVRL